MPIAPRIPQARNEVVSLEGWIPDEDFPVSPLGAKAKRVFVCPNPPPFGFLIGGHRYIFKEPQNSKVQQVWAEVIAYEVGRLIHVEVPPAFFATGPGNGSPGVLVEYFFGHLGDPERRLVHGIERLQARGYDTNFKRGSLSDNLDVCRAHSVPHAGAWWAQTITFDALIGNTDRHSENWGFLVERTGEGKVKLEMAPVFDNGTSLGNIIRDADLSKYKENKILRKFVDKGTHHYGWTSDNQKSSQHIELCRLFAEQYPRTAHIMRDKLSATDSEIDGLVAAFVGAPFPIPFLAERADFVASQMKLRRDLLLNVLRG